MIEVEVTEGVFLSSTYLRDFPVDTIKIDRSFITQLGQGQNTSKIVNAMVGLAHNLSMSIVAEGVETEAQAEFLRAVGCDAAQGYLFARPESAVVAGRQLQCPHRLPDVGCNSGFSTTG
jgi:EAL domain-containing protein (putative c-di-GMP-specific phosphodiesterase class I)